MTRFCSGYAFYTSRIAYASGDLVGYRILGTTVGIRKQADLIFIKRIKNEAS